MNEGMGEGMGKGMGEGEERRVGEDWIKFLDCGEGRGWESVIKAEDTKYGRWSGRKRVKSEGRCSEVRGELKCELEVEEQQQM